MTRDIQNLFYPPNAIKQQQQNYLNTQNYDILFQMF
jgi:hypothetical protein